jgi:hypothetical protein
MCHPHTSLSGSEKEMSGGNYKKTTESTSYAVLGLGASVGSQEKDFNTENAEAGAPFEAQGTKRSRRRQSLAA